MSERRAGLRRVAMRRVGVTDSSGITGLNQGWRPTGWYAPGLNDILNPSQPSIAVLGPSGTDGFLVTVSQLFFQAGTITQIAYYNGNPIGNPGGATTETIMYRSKTTAPWQPGSLAEAVEWHNMGFNTFGLQAVAVAVAAGERLFFTFWSGNQNAGGTFVLNPAKACNPHLGYAWDGVTNPSGVTQYSAVGYKTALAYSGGNPPDPYPAITEPGDLILSNAGAIPTFLFQFTPS